MHPNQPALKEGQSIRLLAARVATRLELFVLILAVVGVGCVRRATSPRTGPALEHPRVQYGGGTAPTEDPGAPERRFSMALFTIYRDARAAEGQSVQPSQSRRLVEAATTVMELKPKFGEFWRRLAVAKLASTGLERPDFRQAIMAMRIEPQTLDALSAKYLTRDHVARFAAVYDYLRQAEVNSDAEGVPACDHTAPQSTAGPQPNDWSATATTTVWLKITTGQLATAADPQNWDNPCGKLLFTDAYVTEPTGGIFPVTACAAKVGTPKPLNTYWKGYLYEHFVAPSLSGNFFANILDITNDPTPGQYSLTYSLEAPLCALIGPDPQVSIPPPPLFADDGSLVGQDVDGSWVFVTGTKTIGFNNVFPTHDPKRLAQDTGATLELLGDSLPYWLCCPK